jgi:hypothetical protein
MITTLQTAEQHSAIATGARNPIVKTPTYGSAQSGAISSFRPNFQRE